jgi:hypothetical protein
VTGGRALHCAVLQAYSGLDDQAAWAACYYTTFLLTLPPTMWMRMHDATLRRQLTAMVDGTWEHCVSQALMAAASWQSHDSVKVYVCRWVFNSMWAM